MTDDDAPFHAHIYYSPDQRSAAAALRQSFMAPEPGDPLTEVCFVGSLRDHKAGPHVVPQFEIHFPKHLAPQVEAAIVPTGLRALIHPLTLDDLGDHTYLGRWIGEPVELDLSVLDPPGVNQGMARYGKGDF